MDMNKFTLSRQLAYTHTVHRPFGGIEDLREIRDPAGRLMVTVFPFEIARRFSAAYETVAACYVLLGHGKIYIGHSRQTGKRLFEHASDPAKSFAGEVYIIHAQHDGWLFRVALQYLEDRLTELAQEAGLVELTNCVSARTDHRSDEDRMIFERFVSESQRLLFDAGCRAINAAPASQLPAAAEANRGVDPADEVPAQIDVDAVPSLGGELGLDCCDLWARGYHCKEGFVVLAGAEVRTVVNRSAKDTFIVELREGFKDVLVPIRGVDDRQRLEAAVLFESAAMAAKFLIGARMGGTKWVRPRYAEQILVAE